MKLARFGLLALLAAVVTLLATSQPAAAHGHVEVGEYNIVIGFAVEPAYQGIPNGLDLRVTNLETGEPVEGLADTLQAELTYGSQTKELDVVARWGQPGNYTAPVIPTEAGDYTWHIWGTINDTPVDIEMSSSPDTFSSVIAQSTVSFPGVELPSTEIADRAESASSRATLALVLGSIGLLFGIVAIILSLFKARA